MTEQEIINKAAALALREMVDLLNPQWDTVFIKKTLARADQLDPPKPVEKRFRLFPGSECAVFDATTSKLRYAHDAVEARGFIDDMNALHDRAEKAQPE